MTRQMVIHGRIINDESPAYLIAEIGSNHQGDPGTAERMIVAAAHAGANAVKLQKRDLDTLMTRVMAEEPYTSPHAFGPTYGEHRRVLEFDEGTHRHLREVAHRNGVDYIVTAFDEPSVELLARVGVDAIKIASADMRNLELIGAALATRLPVIISTGGWTEREVIDVATSLLNWSDPMGWSFLQCTAIYPCPYERTALPVIARYRELLDDVVIGYSGHELGAAIIPAAYAVGARIIEKHFTMDRSWKGGDQHFSLTPDEFRAMARALSATHYAIHATTEKERHDEEIPAMTKLGKGFYAARALPAGHVLTRADIAVKSPAYSSMWPPDTIDWFIGRVLIADLAEEAPMAWANTREHDDA